MILFAVSQMKKQCFTVCNSLQQ